MGSKKRKIKKALKAARARNAAGPAFLAKAAAAARKAAAEVVCLDCRAPNRPGNSCCTSCGHLLPGTPAPPLSMVNKSALADEFWRRETQNSPDPAVRELYKRARYGQTGGIS